MIVIFILLTLLGFLVLLDVVLDLGDVPKDVVNKERLK